MGFVNAAESKERLREIDVPSISTCRHARRNAHRRRGPERDHKHLCPRNRYPADRDLSTWTFSIPTFLDRACPDPQALEKIQSGRWVLLSNGLLLKRGLTTGTTAAAACKGAVLSSEWTG